VSIAVPTADAATIRRAAGECLLRVPLDKKLRLLGVRVSALSRPGDIKVTEEASQGLLFVDP
jgi:DNA polymerase-4